MICFIAAVGSAPRNHVQTNESCGKNYELGFNSHLYCLSNLCGFSDDKHEIYLEKNQADKFFLFVLNVNLQYK